MTQNEIDIEVSKALRQVADEKNLVLVNQVGPPAQHENSEAAQETHEAALASFNTIIKDGIRQSLNSASTQAEVEAFLKKPQGE
jgi:hypothetical protein